MMLAVCWRRENW